MYLFGQKSLKWCEGPEDWHKANITPVFKKGKRSWKLDHICSKLHFFLLKNIYLNNKFVDQGYKTEKLFTVSQIMGHLETTYWWTCNMAFMVDDLVKPSWSYSCENDLRQWKLTPRLMPLLWTLQKLLTRCPLTSTKKARILQHQRVDGSRLFSWRENSG